MATLKTAKPILFVSDVPASAAFFRDKLGFEIDFLYGEPPFYGSVSRDGACLHLRFVHKLFFAKAAAEEGGLILATIEVADVRAFYAEFQSRGVDMPQKLETQDWGGTEFHVRDPDGNMFSFVSFGEAPAA
jgi:catechol 2,3-dioxygenase-like lactoylglutathione lyase family enzyme